MKQRCHRSKNRENFIPTARPVCLGRREATRRRAMRRSVFFILFNALAFTLLVHLESTAVADETTTPVPSAESATNTATTLPEVVVSGTSDREESYTAETSGSSKYTGPLSETPQTINVIPEALMNDQGVTTLREALRNSPGISIQAGEGGTPAGDQMTIRGFSARTDIFVDGVRDVGGYVR